MHETRNKYERIFLLLCNRLPGLQYFAVPLSHLNITSGGLRPPNPRRGLRPRYPRTPLTWGLGPHTRFAAAAPLTSRSVKCKRVLQYCQADQASWQRKQTLDRQVSVMRGTLPAAIMLAGQPCHDADLAVIPIISCLKMTNARDSQLHLQAIDIWNIRHLHLHD